METNVISATGEIISFSESLLKALIVILVVFATLCVLSFVIWLFGLADKKSGQTAKAVSQVPAPADPPVPQASTDDDEVAAVIAAAVASMQPTGVTYQVKKVSPRKDVANTRSEWASAAIRQNTMPC